MLTRRALLGAGAALALAPTALADDGADLAYVRLGVGIEVLGAAFCVRASTALDPYGV